MRQHRGTNLLASGCDSRQPLTLQLSETHKVLSKVACPIALIFNKRRAFSLKLFSNLFGSHSPIPLFSHLSLCPCLFYPFLCCLTFVTWKAQQAKVWNHAVKEKTALCTCIKKADPNFQIVAHRADGWLRQPGRSAVSFPRTTMGTPVERLAGKIVGVAATVRGLFSCERTQPPFRKTHHTKSIHDLIMTPSKFHPF